MIGVAPPIGGAPMEAPRPRTGMLLPLSGPQAPLGQAMLNASTMAMFDEAQGGVEFAPRDTGGTPQGAANAARAAIADGARILVGPLTSAETAAVAPIARGAGVPVLAFTNDAGRAGDGIWVLGATPAQQVRRLVAAAQAQNAPRIALAAPENEFGRALAAGLRDAAAEQGLPRPLILLHPGGADPGMAASAAQGQLGQMDALIIGEAGERARRFAAALVSGLPEGAPLPRLMGTSLWSADSALRAEPALRGAWFPGPDPRARARFDARYRDAFGETPPRLAAVAYDAAALATRALRPGAGGFPSPEVLPGAEGPLRLAPGGQVQRGLAVFAISPEGEPVMLEPAQVPGALGF